MAIKTYSYKKDKNVKLTEHFKVGECRSKDGADKILVDPKLAEIGEKVRSHFEAKSVNLTSGYRTPEHDKKVGGSGSGYHTKGQAWDIYVLDKNNKRIPAKYICCYLQDLGVKGIGYINSTCVHYDTRSKRYWFDETKNNKSIGNDFYNYFGVKKSEIYKEEVVKPTQDFEKNIEELNKNIEELNKKIEELEVKNKTLEERNKALESELESITTYKFEYVVPETGLYQIDLNKDEVLYIKE